jgi:ornithine--oxo-acid transaminase
MFGQVIVMRLFRDWQVLTQMCGNKFMVLTVAPPLVVSREQIDRFAYAITDVVRLMHSPGEFWTQALGLARRAVNI